MCIRDSSYKAPASLPGQGWQRLTHILEKRCHRIHLGKYSLFPPYGEPMTLDELNAIPGVTAKPDVATADFVYNHTMILSLIHI